ncbi:MAG: helix-hairpin-helix domain-containing protein [candidate division Zixibacteria bacterium]|nr:helix-hairpin-helix domain-containing protein [candidate division Zixibacteria bacterium]
MISRIRGNLSRVTDSYVLVENGGVYYEVMVPSGLAERLKENGRTGQEVTFETIYYIEAGDKKSNHYPKLVGFTDPIDKEFFSLFTQVPGLGVKKALKCLVLPIREIATAIETKDPGTLSRLPGVGGRLAEKIIAELNGKTAKFALSRTTEALSKKDSTRPPQPFEKEAVEVLIQLQYKQHEAEEMVRSAMKKNPKVKEVEELISFIFRNELQPGV